MDVRDLPAVNATLNTASAVLLTAGFLFIRRKKVAAHKACMIGAFVVSMLFLVSYVVYHAQAGSTPFPGRGFVRPVYFTILVSHVTLAVVILPMSIITLTRALRGQFDRHKRIARRTLPLWLYVSVTGVAVYWLLYRVYAAG